MTPVHCPAAARASKFTWYVEHAGRLRVMPRQTPPWSTTSTPPPRACVYTTSLSSADFAQYRSRLRCLVQGRPRTYSEVPRTEQVMIRCPGGPQRPHNCRAGSLRRCLMCTTYPIFWTPRGCWWRAAQLHKGYSVHLSNVAYCTPRAIRSAAPKCA